MNRAMSTIKMNQIKNIFFFFYGVLADSLHVKTKAFYELYLPYGESVAQKVMKHHIENGGVSRYEKFKIYHRDFLGKSISEEEVQRLARQFSELVVQGVIASPEVRGARKFLERFQDQCRYWIITGTPTEEMKKIARARGIEHFFVEICGSPTNKKSWVEALLEKYALHPQETLFLGDAASDYEAAKAYNLHFALRVHEDNKALFYDFNGLRFADFEQLIELMA